MIVLRSVRGDAPLFCKCVLPVGGINLVYIVVYEYIASESMQRKDQ